MPHDNVQSYQSKGPPGSSLHGQGMQDGGGGGGGEVVSKCRCILLFSTPGLLSQKLDVKQYCLETIRPLLIKYPRVLFCKGSAILQECYSARGVLFCKGSAILQECYSARGVLFCKGSAILQECYSARGVLFCRSAILQGECYSANVLQWISKKWYHKRVTSST